MQAMTQPPMAGNPQAAPQQPILGPQVPGTTGSLAAPQGLSVYNNPLAQHLQSQGRGQDSMLVHMTPGEVNTLQGLAHAAGGSLTVNPHTGLPEAGFLSSVLPMLAGAALSFIPGIGAPLAAGIVTAGDTAITGSLSKGLMAGLGAFGGASLAGGLAAGAAGGAGAATSGADAATAATGLGSGMPITATTIAPASIGAVDESALSAGIPGVSAGTGAAANLASSAPLSAAGLPPTGLGLGTPVTLTPTDLNLGIPTITPPPPGFLQNFSNAASSGLSGNMAKYAPYAAGLGVLNSVAGAFQGTPGKGSEAQVPVYKGPYHYADPSSSLTNKTPLVMGSNGVYQQPTGMGSYYPQSQLLDAQGNPYVYETAPLSSINQYGGSNLPGYAEGGAMPIKDGAFIVDARTVSELGNGSSGAGQDRLAQLGGKPLRGPGDGVSDSIPASIGGVQKARVARDEVKFDPEDVQRIGGGNHSEGVKKLYAMMDKAHKARKKAKPGQDTKLAKGLGSL